MVLIISTTAILVAASQSLPAAASDTVLTSRIQARFARSKINANHFTVRVEGGLAILEGSTQVVQHKSTATRLARAAGAQKVDNRIRVQEKAETAGTAPPRAIVRPGTP